MGREPVTPEIHGNVVKVLREQGDESVEGVGIVQPAVQAENRGALRRAPGFGGDVAPGHRQLQLGEQPWAEQSFAVTQHSPSPHCAEAEGQRKPGHSRGWGLAGSLRLSGGPGGASAWLHAGPPAVSSRHHLPLACPGRAAFATAPQAPTRAFP